MRQAKLERVPTSRRSGYSKQDIRVGETYELKLAVRDRLLNVWLNGKPTLLDGDHLVADLPRGRHNLTLSVDQKKRKQPIRLEMFDVDGSAAQARFVGAK